MIIMFTDFGYEGPYLGQMEAVIEQVSPAIRVINLLSNAPVYNPYASSILLEALSREFPNKTTFLCVIDPGVGSVERIPVVVEAGGKWYVGPDNGLFSRVIGNDPEARKWEILWRPERLSSSFHGRDLFAPVAARLAAEKLDSQWLAPMEISAAAPSDALAEVIYIDHYGNAMTGIPCDKSADSCRLEVNGKSLTFATTFSDVPVGEPFFYCNSIGLLEIAVNQGRADKSLKLVPGSKVELKS